MEQITLTSKYGEPGIDQHGNMWTEFIVDAFAEQLPGECAECGAELESGWMCLDGGDEVCDSHVTLIESA